MNINFSQWAAERRLKEANLGQLSASGFQDMTGDEADEMGVKKQAHQQPLRQMFGQRKRPEVFVDPNTLDQLSAREEDPAAYLDDEDAMQHRFAQDEGEPTDVSDGRDFAVGQSDDHPWDADSDYYQRDLDYADDMERHHTMGEPYQSPANAAHGDWSGENIHNPQLPPEVQVNPNDTHGFDAQAALEQPSFQSGMGLGKLSKKQMRELRKSQMKKALKSWKDYKRARKAQSHVIGDPYVPRNQAEINDRINNIYPRRFR